VRAGAGAGAGRVGGGVARRLSVERVVGKEGE